MSRPLSPCTLGRGKGRARRQNGKDLFLISGPAALAWTLVAGKSNGAKAPDGKDLGQVDSFQGPFGGVTAVPAGKEGGI